MEEIREIYGDDDNELANALNPIMKSVIEIIIPNFNAIRFGMENVSFPFEDGLTLDSMNLLTLIVKV